MGIQLDWQVESDNGRDAIEEDAQSIAAHQRRSRRLWITILAVTITLALITGLGVWRFQRVEAARLEALHAAVEAEALALRLGNKHQFMQLQGSSESWRAIQRQHFDEIQALGVGVNVTGKILDVHFIEDEAEVFVEIIIDGVPQQGAWLYEYTDKGWRHVATRQTPWYTRTTGIGPLTFTFNSVLSPDVDRLKALLRQWWADAGDAAGIPNPPRLDVEISPDVESVRWSDGGQHKLLIPSPVLANANLDDPNDPLRVQLAIMLADQWADYIMPPHLTDTDLEVWENWQIGLAMQSTFGLPPDPYYVLDELTPSFGSEFTVELFTTLKVSGDGLVSLQQAVRHHAPAIVDETYFRSLLAFLVANSHDPTMRFDASRASLVFIDADDDRWAADFALNDWLMGIQPDTIVIRDIEPLGDLIWVTIAYDYNPYWYGPSQQAESYPLTRQIPFRSVNGLWKVTSPRPADWGETIVKQGEFITFAYPEMDATYFKDMLPTLEHIYTQAAADFALDPPPAIEINIQTIDSYSYDSEPDIIRPLLGSPHLMAQSPDTTMDDLLHAQAVDSIYYEIFEYVAGAYTSNTYGGYQMEFALRRWLMQKHGWERPSSRDWISSVEVQPDVAMPNDWDDLWQTTISYNDQAHAEYYWALMDIATDTLLATIFQFGGEEAFLPMVQNLRQHNSMQAWIEASLIYKNYDELEIKYMEEWWEAEFRKEVRRIFGDQAFE